METIKRSVVTQSRGERMMSRWSIEHFQGSEITLHNTIMVDTCHYTFIETHRLCSTKSET